MKNIAKKLLMVAMCLLISLTMVPALTNTTKIMAVEQKGDKNGL